MDQRIDIQILAELRAMRTELQEIREQQEDIARHMLDRDDRRIGAVLLPLLAKIFAAETFATATVMAKAVGKDLNGQVLYELIGDRLGGDGAALVVGRLLARLEGVRFKGYYLVIAGQVRGVRLWRVSHASKPATRDIPRGGGENSLDDSN